MLVPWTHDYIRNRTTSPFTALDIATGKVIGSLYRRQQYQESRCSLERIDEPVPEAIEIHLVTDNDVTHKMPQSWRWLAQRLHYHVHFAPTSGSPLNKVERFSGRFNE